MLYPKIPNKSWQRSNPFLDNVRIFKAHLMQRPSLETFKYSTICIYCICICICICTCSIMYLYLTPRIPNSCAFCSCSSQKASHGDISGTKRGIIDQKQFCIRKFKKNLYGENGSKRCQMVPNGPKL